ncbi:fimbrial assembly protein [Cellulomonas sp. NS3]|uniref:fimbrial assembly protein n=1 Tax=Cellulomonas sp. NS3 TaxID=2973977 RepID=UPI00216375C6|nr:fimbrial assembly protein [Cellulomonas sp. NS3]
MSLTLEKPSRRGGGVLVGAPELPQVNLLPPEVRAARGLVHLKRWLALAFVVVLVLVAGLYGAALLARGSADSELAEAQARAAELQAQEAEYAEVPRVVNDLRRATEARTLGMSTEVLWKQYLDAVAAVLPTNVSISTFTVAQATPVTAPEAPADPLATQGIGTITFTSTAVGLPDNAAWIDALNSVPGFYAANATAEALGEDDGVVAYTVSSTVQVNETAFALRFAPVADAAAATEGN